MLRRGRRTHAHLPAFNTQGSFDPGTAAKHGGSRVLHMHIADFGVKRTSSSFSPLNVGLQARRTPLRTACARPAPLACSLARMPGASSHAT